MDKANEEDLLDCPLLSMKIDSGACYDINAVAAEWVIEEVLKFLEEEYCTIIHVESAKIICPSCKHCRFTY